MQDWRFREYERNIGLIGVYYSGKTVFLTSLINHLLHHQPERFALRTPDAVVRKFKRAENDPGWGMFDYQAARDSMLFERRWPRKTADRSQFVCTFERSDWKLGRAKVRFFDLPGERIADASMAQMDFATWSEHIYTMIRTDKTYRVNAGDYLRAVEEGAPPDQVVRSYKLALARLIHAFKPYISPSTFLLDTQGRLASNVPPEELARERISGLGADDEFAPLPSSYREFHQEVVTLYAERYERYRRVVVAPLVDHLMDCHSLIVMVDVTMLLAGGTGMYNDNRQLVADLLEMLDPGRGTTREIIADRVGKLIDRGKQAWRRRFQGTDLPPGDGETPANGRTRGRIRRIAFVAPKLDLVHPLDREQMVSLLREMTEGCVRDRDGVIADYFHCSAVVSTVVKDAQKRMLVMASGVGAEGEQQAREFQVSALPDRWPDSWSPGAYTFPEALPRWPERKDLPPKQVNLDKIFEFVVA